MLRIKILTFLFFYGVNLLWLTESIFCDLVEEGVKNICNYHAIIEIVEFTSDRGEIVTIKEEWFKKPNLIRRELLTLDIGSMKKVLIYDGNKSYSYFPLGDNYYHEEYFDYTPSFYSYKVSDQTVELFDRVKPKIEAEEGEFNGREAYVARTQAREENQEVSVKFWIDKETFLPLGWEKKFYDPEGKVDKYEFCRKIEYIDEMSDKLFKIPTGYKFVKEEIPSKIPVDLKVDYKKLTPERIKQILSQEKQLREIISKYPNSPGAYAQLGNIILFEGKYEEAIKLLNKSLELNSRQEKVYVTLADIYTVIEEFDKAIESMKKVLQFSPKDSYGYFRLGKLYEKAGFFDKAVAVYKRALELQPNDTIRDGERIYRIKGLRKEYLKAYKKAKEKLKQETHKIETK